MNLKMLAKELGLSEGTVSRALNGYPDVSDQTRQRVKETADHFGYRPNTSARRLAKGNSECVGYVLPWLQGYTSTPFLAELLDGLTEVLASRHWDLTVAAPRSAEDELAQIERLARSGHVNGLVISRTFVHDPRIDKLRQLKIPFVAHGRTENCEDFAWLDVDGRAAFRHAVRHLASLGHRRIGMIAGDRTYNFAVERQKGYAAGLLDHGLEYDADLVVRSGMTDASGYQCMQALLTLSSPPTAVVCLSDMVALGAMKALTEVGKLPGRDVSIIGYDGLPMGRYAHPALTTMEQPLRAAGQKIGEMLFALIDGDSPKNQQVLWQASLVRRETDGPPLPA